MGYEIVFAPDEDFVTPNMVFYSAEDKLIKGAMHEYLRVKSGARISQNLNQIDFFFDNSYRWDEEKNLRKSWDDARTSLEPNIGKTHLDTIL